MPHVSKVASATNIMGEKHIQGVSPFIVFKFKQSPSTQSHTIRYYDKTAEEFRLEVAKSLRVDPSTVVFSFHRNTYKIDFRILSIARSSTFAENFNIPNSPDIAARTKDVEDYENMLTAASATNTVGILERVVCRYGARGEDYCQVLFKYKQRGLTRVTSYDGEMGWYEYPIQGRSLEAPPQCEVFPGRKHGDLFLNWVEYPVRCQVWRFRNVIWSPFQEAAWEPLYWGFQDPVTQRVLVILPLQNRPLFVSKLTYESGYKGKLPVV